MWTNVSRIPAVTGAVKTPQGASGVSVTMVTGSLGTPVKVKVAA